MSKLFLGLALFGLITAPIVFADEHPTGTTAAGDASATAAPAPGSDAALNPDKKEAKKAKKSKKAKKELKELKEGESVPAPENK